MLSLSEDAYKGDAQAVVTIDGHALTSQPITITASQGSGQTETFTLKGDFGLGAHDLAVSFLNDAYGGSPSTDRNLYLNGATYDGIATRPSTATFLTGGTQHFTVPPAGDPEALHSTLVHPTGH